MYSTEIWTGGRSLMSRMLPCFHVSDLFKRSTSQGKRRQWQLELVQAGNVQVPAPYSAQHLVEPASPEENHKKLMGKPQENRRKTIGTWWLNGI